MENYISWLRSLVGHAPIFVNAASCVITNEAGEVLLQRRGGGEKNNSWSFPGGVMEIGETPRQTAEREISEETGLKVNAGRLIGVYTCPELVKYPNGDVCQMVTQVFESQVCGGTLCADGNETLELRYFSLATRPALFRSHLERAMQDYAAGKFGISN